MQRKLLFIFIIIINFFVVNCLWFLLKLLMIFVVNQCAHGKSTKLMCEREHKSQHGYTIMGSTTWANTACTVSSRVNTWHSVSGGVHTPAKHWVRALLPEPAIQIKRWPYDRSMRADRPTDAQRAPCWICEQRYLGRRVFVEFEIGPERILRRSACPSRSRKDLVQPW
jgi:hypothetical protein